MADSSLLDIAEALTSYADDPRPTTPARPAPITRPVDDRRAHVRVRPLELPRPMLARLKHGPILTLLDVSPGGALIETPARLNPGTQVVLEFFAPGRRSTLVPSRVIRAHVAALSSGSVRYRGGFSFRQLLSLTEPEPPVERPLPPAEAAALAQAIASLRTVAHGARDRRVARLIDDILSEVPLCRTARALMAAVEARLRRCLPLLTIGFATAPRTRATASDALSFDLGHAGGQDRMHVEFQPACPLDAGQLRLLHAGVSVMSLIYGWQRRTAAAL